MASVLELEQLSPKIPLRNPLKASTSDCFYHLVTPKFDSSHSQFDSFPYKWSA